MTILTSKIKKPINTEKIIKEKLKDTKPIYERIKEIVETKKNKSKQLYIKLLWLWFICTNMAFFIEI